MNKDIGKKVKVYIDRPLGSIHPLFPNIQYEVNYGYIRDTIGGDNEYQDAYILGVDCKLSEFDGIVTAIIERQNDVETKWVVIKEGMQISTEEIIEKTNFMEKYFQISIIR